MAEAKKLFWTVQIDYEHGYGRQMLTHRVKNCTMRRDENEPSLPSVQALRNIIFSDGLLIPVDPSRFIIVSPWNIRSVEVYRQDRYINEP